MIHLVQIVRSFYWLSILLIGISSSTYGQGQVTAYPRLRVVTYNIHHGEGMDHKINYRRLAKIIISLKPDLVALQEVDQRTNRANGTDQAAHLGKLTEMLHVFGNAMYFSGGEYGEAILSRFPMEQVQTHPLPFRFGQEPRIALAVHIKPANGVPELIFVSTHLCHQSNETRMEQAQQINHWFQLQGGPPIVLAGDLNARPDSEPMEVLLKEHWVDAIAPKSRIDYVLYRKSDPWKVVDVQIIDDRVASDHRPVLAILEWRGEMSTR